jgi:protein TonB
MVKGSLLAVFANIIIFVILTRLIEGNIREGEKNIIHAVNITDVRLQPDIPKPEDPEPKEPEPPKKEEPITPQKEKIFANRQKPEFEMPDINLNPALKDTGFSMPAMSSDSVPQKLGPDGITAMDDLDKIPVPKYKKPPVYPHRAKRMGIEGQVSISFIVHKNGSISDITILKAEPEGVFEQSVMEAVSSWEYSPGELMGENVKTLVSTVVIFKLEGKE